VDELLEFRLCRACRDRQGAAGKDLPLASEEGCFICGGVSGNLGRIAEKVVAALAKFEFRTFSVGLMLPHGVQEREDTLRSEMKIRGLKTIKSDLAGRLASAVVKKLRGKRVDRFHPDATALIDIGDGKVIVTSKPLYVYARYTKPRGVAQRKLFCEGCDGRGCEKCGGSGYSSSPSVEASVSKKLRALLGSERFKFTWFGSEDAESAVFPPGRPMVVESKNPLRRRLPKSMKLRTGGGAVMVSGVRVLAKKLEHPTFTFMTRAVISAESKVSEEDVRRLQRDMRNALVRYRNNKGRLVDKRIYFVRAKARGRRITADIKLDGGLPVKRLVSGDAVSPSFSESMRTPLRCERFDIVRVWPKPVKGR
jgi:tRNA pseudouridine synthase 10